MNDYLSIIPPSPFEISQFHVLLLHPYFSQFFPPGCIKSNAQLFNANTSLSILALYLHAIISTTNLCNLWFSPINHPHFLWLIHQFYTLSKLTHKNPNNTAPWLRSHYTNKSPKTHSSCISLPITSKVQEPHQSKHIGKMLATRKPYSMFGGCLKKRRAAGKNRGWGGRNSEAIPSNFDLGVTLAQNNGFGGACVGRRWKRSSHARSHSWFFLFLWYCQEWIRVESSVTSDKYGSCLGDLTIVVLLYLFIFYFVTKWILFFILANYHLD